MASEEDGPRRTTATAMRLKINYAEAEGNTRPVGLRFALMTLRILEHWRSHLGVDLDSTLIVLATAAITMEKFSRADFQPELRDINSSMPPNQLTRCNVSSIAAATGMNRETTRRKVRNLVDAGILLRDETGALRLSPGYTRMVPTGAMLRSQLQTLVQAANDLVRERILEHG